MPWWGWFFVGLATGLFFWLCWLFRYFDGTWR